MLGVPAADIAVGETPDPTAGAWAVATSAQDMVCIGIGVLDRTAEEERGILFYINDPKKDAK